MAEILVKCKHGNYVDTVYFTLHEEKYAMTVCSYCKGYLDCLKSIANSHDKTYASEIFSC